MSDDTNPYESEPWYIIGEAMTIIKHLVKDAEEACDKPSFRLEASMQSGKRWLKKVEALTGE